MHISQALRDSPAPAKPRVDAIVGRAARTARSRVEESEAALVQVLWDMHDLAAFSVMATRRAQLNSPMMPLLVDLKPQVGTVVSSSRSNAGAQSPSPGLSGDHCEWRMYVAFASSILS